MFNQAQKEQFIDYKGLVSNSSEIESYKISLTNFFNRLEPHEDILDKDFSHMSKDEINNTVSNFLTGGVSYQKQDLSVLTQYLDWAIQHKYTSHQENVLIGKRVKDFDTSRSYSNIMLKDEDELDDILCEVLRPLEEDSADNNSRCYLHLLYAGLNQDEAIDLKVSCIDPKRNVININDRQVLISKRLKKIIEYTLDMEYFVQRVGKVGLRKNYITKTGYLLENTVDVTEKSSPTYRQTVRKSMNVVISQKLSECRKSITPTNIILSGIFYRMYLAEMETGEVDCIEYLTFKRDNISVIEKTDLVVANCKAEYSMWKKAFKLA